MIDERQVAARIPKIGRARGALAALALMLGGAPCAAHEPAAKPPQRVMFVGNSLTEYNGGMAQHVLQLALGGDKWNAPYYKVAAITLGGARLQAHRDKLETALRNGLPWDVVVLQGHSLEPITPGLTAAEFRDAVRDLDAIVRHGRSRVALFMTWAYRGKPEMTAQLFASYGAAAKEIGATVVPVGLAFERIRATAPHIILTESDGIHPTRAGTYLAACVFHATFFERSPEGNSYHAQLSPLTAETLQAAAWLTVRDYNGW